MLINNYPPPHAIADSPQQHVAAEILLILLFRQPHIFWLTGIYRGRLRIGAP